MVSMAKGHADGERGDKGPRPTRRREWEETKTLSLADDRTRAATCVPWTRTRSCPKGPGGRRLSREQTKLSKLRSRKALQRDAPGKGMGRHSRAPAVAAGRSMVNSCCSIWRIGRSGRQCPSGLVQRPRQCRGLTGTSNACRTPVQLCRVAIGARQLTVSLSTWPAFDPSQRFRTLRAEPWATSRDRSQRRTCRCPDHPRCPCQALRPWAAGFPTRPAFPRRPPRPKKMTTLDATAATLGKRKRRRRREDKPAVSARLVLDDHVKGDVGYLSEDLYLELFPQLRHGELPRQPWEGVRPCGTCS